MQKNIAIILDIENVGYYKVAYLDAPKAETRGDEN